MENQNYLAYRKTIQEWEVGKGLLNGWATVFGVLALLTIIGRTALLFRQYQATILYSGILLLLAVAVYRLMWWRRKGTGAREFVRLEEEGIRYCGLTKIRTRRRAADSTHVTARRANAVMVFVNSL